MNEKLQELKAKEGTEVHVGPWLEVTQERIRRFAEVTMDEQWIHVDPDRAARESPFGTTIAHGFLTLSLTTWLTGALDPSTSPFPDARVVINYGLNKVRFPYPVRAGSRIRARTTLLSVAEVKGAIEVVRQVTVEIEGADKPACVAETVTRYYFD